MRFSNRFDPAVLLQPRARLSSIPGEGVYERPISPYIDEERKKRQKDPLAYYFNTLKKACTRSFTQKPKTTASQDPPYNENMGLNNFQLEQQQRQGELQDSFANGRLEGTSKIMVPDWRWNSRRSKKWLYKILRTLPEDIGKKSRKEARQAIKNAEKKHSITGTAIYILRREDWMGMLGCTVGAFVHDQMLLIKADPSSWSNLGTETWGNESAILDFWEREDEPLNTQGLIRHRTTCSCFGDLDRDALVQQTSNTSPSNFSISTFFRSTLHRNEPPGRNIPEVTRKQRRSPISF